MNAFDIWIFLVASIYLTIAFRTRHFARMPQLNLIEIPRDMTWPRVSLIAPACNEEATIEQAAKKLLLQEYPNLEIVLINDRSTDRTGEIIERISRDDSRIKPLHIRELPAGWLGKLNAVAKGIEASSGEYFLVTDADIHFSRHCLQKAIALCKREGFEFLTVLPDLIANSLLLRVCLAHFAHIVAILKPIRSMNNSGTEGVGAFLLFRRDAYLRSEKYEWLKLEVIDDAGAAYMMKRSGAKMGVIAGHDELVVEWYPSLWAFIRGLEKNSFAGSEYSAVGLVISLSLNALFTGAILVAPWFAGLSWSGAAVWSALAIALASFGWQMQKFWSIRAWEVMLTPIAAFVIFPFIVIRSAFITLKNGGIYWRGTFYPLAELRAGQRLKIRSMIRKKN